MRADFEVTTSSSIEAGWIISDEPCASEHEAPSYHRKLSCALAMFDYTVELSPRSGEAATKKSMRTDIQVEKQHVPLAMPQLQRAVQGK